MLLLLCNGLTEELQHGLVEQMVQMARDEPDSQTAHRGMLMVSVAATATSALRVDAPPPSPPLAISSSAVARPGPLARWLVPVEAVERVPAVEVVDAVHDSDAHVRVARLLHQRLQPLVGGHVRLEQVAQHQPAQRRAGLAGRKHAGHVACATSGAHRKTGHRHAQSRAAQSDRVSRAQRHPDPCSQNSSRRQTWSVG